jgi:hypothetical protein
LLAHRHLPAEALLQAMRQAANAGVTEAVVLVEARRIADHQPAAQAIPIGALHRFDRPTPALAGYDSLLDHQAAQQVHGDGQDQPDLEIAGAEIQEVGA